MYMVYLLGYRPDGYNRDRYARTGYNCQGLDTSSLNEDGLLAGFSYICEFTSKTECMEKVQSNNSQDEVGDVVSIAAGKSF